MRTIILVIIGLFVVTVAIGCSSDDAVEDGDSSVATGALVNHESDEADASHTDEVALTVVDEDHDADGHSDEVALTVADDDHEADGHSDEGAVHDDDEGEIVEITLKVVEGSTWGFSPSDIEVQVGERVRLTLVNGGLAEHDIEITHLVAEHIERMGGMEHGMGGDDHSANVVAAHAMPGMMASVIFTPTEVGVYEFACTLPGHKQAGMVGSISVNGLVASAIE